MVDGFRHQEQLHSENNRKERYRSKVSLRGLKNVRYKYNKVPKFRMEVNFTIALLHVKFEG